MTKEMETVTSEAYAQSSGGQSLLSTIGLWWWMQGFRPQAMAVTCDPEHKFELSLQLGDLKTAYQLASETEVGHHSAVFTYLHSINFTE